MTNRLFIYLTKIVLVAVLIGIALPPGVEADEFEIIPSVLVREEYNDNIFFTKDDKIDDFITTLAGSLELTERTERLYANLYGRVAPFWYADNIELDDTDWLARATADYRFTPRFKGRADAGFLIDHRPDRDTEITGVVLDPRRRKRWDAGLGAEYNFSEISTGSLNYFYRVEDWDEGSIDDQKVHDVTFGLAHNLYDWWETTIARVNFGYSNFNYETSDTEIIFGSVGMEQRFTEKFTVLFDLGPRYSSSDFDTLRLKEVSPGVSQLVVVSDSDNQWGGVGLMDIKYREERTVSSFIGSHGLYPVSGRPGPTERTTARFNLTHLFTEKLRVSLPLGWIRIRADGDEFSVDEIDQDSVYVQPFLRWEFYNGFTLEGQYNFSYVWDYAEDEERYRHLAFLQLAYGLPLFDLLRDFDPVSGGRPGFGYQESRYGR